MIQEEELAVKEFLDTLDPKLVESFHFLAQKYKRISILYLMKRTKCSISMAKEISDYFRKGT